jgi:hypothetical protein
MKKIYLLAFSSLFAVAVTAQTTVKIKNPMKKRSSVERNGTPNQVNQVASTIVSNTQYVAGTTMDLNFTLTMTNQDGEYGDYLAITFPAGITPTGMGNTSNPFPNTEDAAGGLETMNPVAGQMISWGSDNDDTYGGIWSSTGIQFTVECTIAPGTTGNLTATYDLKGDKYASTQGGVDGDQLGATFTIYESGAALVDLQTDFIQPYNLTALQVCNYGMDTLIAQIKNVGTTTEDTITVTYSVNGVVQPALAFPITLAPGDSSYVAWLPAYDFSAQGIYALSAWVAQPSDISTANDTATFAFVNSVSHQLTSTPYMNGCEPGYEFESLNRAYVSGDGYIFGPSQVTFQSGTQALFYTVPNSATAGTHEAMVIMPCMDVVAGETYRITFYKRINGSAVTANGQSGVFSGLANDPAAMTAIKPYTAITPYGSWIKDSADFVATATETRYFALGGTGAVVAGSNQINVRYDNINIFKVPAPNGIAKNNAVEMSIFPNPSNGIVNLNLAVANAQVEIFNVIGERVFSKSQLNKGMNVLDLSSVSEGTYIVRILSGNEVSTKKITISK